MTFWVAGGTVVGSIGSGLFGASSARKAARAQQEAIDAARREARKGYEESSALYQPYYQTGTAASNRLATLLGIGGEPTAQGYGDLTRPFSMADYQQDPGYQFRLKEGLKNIQRTAASRGGALSGTTQLGLQSRAQDLASQEYGNAYDRYRQRQQDIYNMLYGEQGRGYQSASDLSNLRGNLSSNIMNLALGQGNVQAQKEMAMGDIYGNMLGSITGAIGGGMADYKNKLLQKQQYTDWLNRAYPQSGTGGGSSTYGGYGGVNLSNPFSTNWKG